jgi:hypothetical protein
LLGTSALIDLVRDSAGERGDQQLSLWSKNAGPSVMVQFLRISIHVTRLLWMMARTDKSVHLLLEMVQEFNCSICFLDGVWCVRCELHAVCRVPAVQITSVNRT